MNIKGGVNQNVPGAAYDRLTKTPVLRKGQNVSQMIRLDTGKLGGMLLQNPIMSCQLYVSVVTNPTTGANGAVVPGPAGFRHTMRRVIDRGARPISMPDQQQKVFDLLSSGTAAEKIHALSFLAKCYVL